MVGEYYCPFAYERLESMSDLDVKCSMCDRNPALDKTVSIEKACLNVVDRHKISFVPMEAQNGEFCADCPW
jgi:hypothetical protein